MHRAFPASLLFCLALHAQQAEVRHKHMIGGSKVTMHVTADGLAVEETGKNADHSRNMR